MATLDDLYTQLGTAKAAWNVQRTALQQHTATWTAALVQLKLLASRVPNPNRPHPVTPPVPAPTTTYTVADLPGLATAVLQSQTAHDAAKKVVDDTNALIQAAIAAKGAA